jgi:hypothetical protein
MIADVETVVILTRTAAEHDDDAQRYRLRGFVQHVGSGKRDDHRPDG